MGDQEEITSILLDYHLIIKVKCCLDQFVDGLEVLNIHTELKRNPDLWKPIFVQHASSLTTGKECGLPSIVCKCMIKTCANDYKNMKVHH